MKRVVFTTTEQTVVHANKSGVMANILMGLATFFTQKLAAQVGNDAASKALLIAIASNYSEDKSADKIANNSANNFATDTCTAPTSSTEQNDLDSLDDAQNPKEKPLGFELNGKAFSSFTEYMNAKSQYSQNEKQTEPKPKKTAKTKTAKTK